MAADFAVSQERDMAIKDAIDNLINVVMFKVFLMLLINKLQKMCLNLLEVSFKLNTTRVYSFTRFRFSSKIIKI